MPYRLLVSGSAVAAVVATISLAPVSVKGQARPSAGAAKPNAAAPRTQWGKPDLQGVWDFRTVTPLERPNDLAGKQVLNDVEAASFESQAAVRNDRDRNVPAGNVGDYNQFWYDRGTQVAGNKRTSLIIDPSDGRIPAFTDEAKKRKDRKSTRLNSSHIQKSRMPSSA